MKRLAAVALIVGLGLGHGPSRGPVGPPCQRKIICPPGAAQTQKRACAPPACPVYIPPPTY